MLADDEEATDFLRRLNWFVIRRGGRRLAYFGIYSPIFDDGRPHRHLHFVLALPERSRERKAVQKFLRNRPGMGGRSLWFRGKNDDPLQPAHLAAITDKPAGYDGIPGLVDYWQHHFDDAAKFQPGTVKIHASDDVRAEARWFGEHCREVLNEIEARYKLPFAIPTFGPVQSASAGLSPSSAMPALNLT
ncbi:MAG: hypothetical protein HYR63_11980 [Proteobacteria bacterium]|nr:hypothetical protein [Pseudomonadota bacterium]MBI3498519.1 hypothetical protein [Pseudomonadota bacterium]